jgi:hypothetical protein
MLFACPHCDAIVEFLDPSPRDPECDCGAVLESFEGESPDVDPSDGEAPR